MTLTLELTPEEAARLAAAAEQEGVDPAVLVRKLVSQHLPPALANVPLRAAEDEDPTLALLHMWDREDAEMTPDEQEEARREFEEFKHNLNAERARAGSRPIYS